MNNIINIGIKSSESNPKKYKLKKIRNTFVISQSIKKTFPNKILGEKPEKQREIFTPENQKSVIIVAKEFLDGDLAKCM